MNCRFSRRAVLAAVFALGVAADARAQIPISGPGGMPGFRPTTSPYLNLLRSGTSPAINYYGIVRPEVNFLNSINNLQQQTANNQAAIGDLQFGGVPMTGHSVQFLNTGSYFGTMRGGIGASPYVTRSQNVLSNSPFNQGSQLLGGGSAPAGGVRR